MQTDDDIFRENVKEIAELKEEMRNNQQEEVRLQTELCDRISNDIQELGRRVGLADAVPGDEAPPDIVLD